jgi:hypothetical protein
MKMMIYVGAAPNRPSDEASDLLYVEIQTTYLSQASIHLAKSFQDGQEVEQVNILQTDEHPSQPSESNGYQNSVQISMNNAKS